MNSYFRIDVNLLSAVMLIAILFIAYGRLDRKDRLNRAFLYTSLIVIMQLVTEAMTCVLNGMAGDWVRPAALFLHAVLFLAAPLLTASWFRLSRLVSGIPVHAGKAVIVLFLMPLLISVTLSVASVFTGVYFDIGEGNVYVRGPLFFLSAMMTYFYLIATLVRILAERRHYIREDFSLMIAATVIPMLGGVLQSVFYGVLLMWSSVAFSLIVVFIFLEQRFIRVDRLTGARTRDSFDYHIRRRVIRPEPFGLVYLDLDGLKTINDNFGHAEGDAALRTVANTIQDAIGKDDYLVRLGGDEFLGFVDNVDMAGLITLVEQGKKALERYNATSGKPYRIDVSVGCALYDDPRVNIEDFIRRVDHLMYLDKQKKQAAEPAPRRNGD
ncbi:MAG: diguanylate cyclase [Candidatus Izemoplasmatales bacterium]